MRNVLNGIRHHPDRVLADSSVELRGAKRHGPSMVRRRRGNWSCPLDWTHPQSQRKPSLSRFVLTLDEVALIAHILGQSRRPMFAARASGAGVVVVGDRYVLAGLGGRMVRAFGRPR